MTITAVTACMLAAAILSIVELAKSQLKSILAWAVLLLSLALLVGRF